MSTNPTGYDETVFVSVPGDRVVWWTGSGVGLRWWVLQGSASSRDVAGALSGRTRSTGGSLSGAARSTPGALSGGSRD